MIPLEIHSALSTVTGLKQGHSAAPESEPVIPVEDAAVDATLPHLGRFVGGLVEFQRLTGSRPGEACRVRRSEIDATGKIWIYKPTQHKTARRGKTRAIAIGPKAQAVLREFFTEDPTA